MSTTPADPRSDPDLIRRARGRDETAWRLLVEAHQQPVYRYAYLLLGDAAEAEDVAQEAFIRAYRGLAGFDEARALRPWLLSIAGNLARNRRRALGRATAALQRLLRAGHGAPAGVEEVAARRWQAEALWRAVRRLGAADQQVIYLRYFLDLPTAEVSAALGVPAGTVKSRLHRALRRLQAVIRREAPGLVPEDAGDGDIPLAGRERG